MPLLDRMPGRSLGEKKEILERLAGKVGRQEALFENHDSNATLDSFLLRGLGNDIFPVPDCKNPERWEQCKTSFKSFCEEYFAARFYLKWAKGHLESLEIMQDAVVNGGGYYTLAEPRGSGKSCLAECMALWAMLYGYRKFVVVVGATAIHAKEIYKSVLTEIETNGELLVDFPEVCYPIWRLNCSYIRAKTQHVQGKHTRITINSDSLVFPYIEHSDVSGSMIQCVSITGRIRGLKRTIANTSEVIRPDFVIIDDPQTDRSARSPMQVGQREQAIVGTILGLAGPNSNITAVMPCTVIRNDDLAERFLDHERRPEWRGKRTPMLYSFPSNMDAWKDYAEIQANSYRSGNKGEEATKFYVDNRSTMDEGAAVSWEERYNPKMEVSAIQHAMNLWIRDPRAFAAEYQNKPLIESNNEQGRVVLEAKQICSRLSGTPYGVCPRETEFITTGIDIQQKILYYLTVAWTKDFGGTIVDYGSFPKQKESYWSRENPPITMTDELPDLLLAPQVYKGLEFIRDYCMPVFTRDESSEHVRIEKALIDANWNLVSDAVFSFCKENETVGLFKPANGKGIGAVMLPMEAWPKKTGEQTGKNWKVRLHTGAGRGRHTIYDTNFWKSRIAERLLAPLGSPNCLKLYGSKSYHHQMLADQLSSEGSHQLTGRGRSVNEWRSINARENDWWDCLILAAVAVSQCGLTLHEMVVTENGKTSTRAIPARTRRERIDLKKL